MIKNKLFGAFTKIIQNIIPSSKKLFISFMIALWLSGGMLSTFNILGSSKAQANTKYASFVMEEVSKRVLYARNADKQLYPASLAKIMTLYIVFEELQSKNLTLSSQIPISSLSASRSPSKLYLKPGETISVEDAILALVTKSANDIATAVSEKFRYQSVNLPSE